jgi:hypothetical protein
MGRHLDEFAAELRESGEAAFARRYSHPFVVRDVGDAVAELAQSDDQDTDVSSEEVRHFHATARVAGDIEAVGRELEAFPVVKRPGGAFADRIGVGRARNADVCLPHGRVSKYHAYFSRAGDGGWTLTDARSTNGTWVEGEPLEPGHAVPVRDGARVRFGPFVFLFVTADGFRRLVAARA